MRKSTLYKTFDPTENDDKKIAIMIVAFFSYSLVTLLINTLVNYIIPNTPIDTAVCMTVYFAIIFFAIAPVSRRLSVISILFPFLCIGIILSHCVIFSQNSTMLINLLIKFTIKILPLFLLGYSIRNYKMVLAYLQKSSHYMIFVAFAYYVIQYIAKIGFVDDNMSFAYYLLPFSVISIYSLVENITIPNIIRTIIALTTHLLTGTRGPFVCLAVSALFFVLFNKNKDKRKIIWAIVFVAIVAFMYTSVFSEILLSVDEFFQKNNINNRIIQKLLEDEFLDDSGRERIRQTLNQALMDRPFIGYGIAGERPLVFAYSHSIIYDLMMHFGVIVGFGLFALLCIAIVKNMVATHISKSEKTILIFMISCSFIKLFMSGSYINEPNFFLLLGILFSINKAKGQNVDEKIA